MSTSEATAAAGWERGKNRHVRKELPGFLEMRAEATVTEPSIGEARHIKGTRFEHLFENPKVVENRTTRLFIGSKQAVRMTQVHQKGYSHSYTVVHAGARVFDIKTKGLMPASNSRSSQSTKTYTWQTEMKGIDNTPADERDKHME